MRRLLFLSAMLLFSQSALADGTVYECLRSRSTCTGPGCFKYAESMKTKYLDKKLLPPKSTEKVQYTLNDGTAQEMARSLSYNPNLPNDIQTPKQIVNQTNFNYVMNTADLIRLENKDVRTDQIKDRIEIYPKTGFYAAYKLSTDGSLKGIPIGTPYMANFGWCKKPVTK